MSSKKVQDLIQSWISQTFQLERLDQLAKGSIFLRVAYAELIGNINYALLHEPASGDEMIVIAQIAYPLTLPGRKAAIAESFRHFANKLDDFLSTSNTARILGSMDFVGDIASAALRGQRTTQRVTVPKA